jgi:hypothetical protein
LSKEVDEETESIDEEKDEDAARPHEVREGEAGNRERGRQIRV